MPAYYLEALTVFLGLILLMVEAFGPRDSKKLVGFSAAAGLAFILILSFYAVGPEAADPGDKWDEYALWNFYAYDSLARFYKGFALVCTILVVLMSLDYRSILSRFTDDQGSENGTGEYFALPVFACAGMMCTPTEMGFERTCNDMMDNDCNGAVDCADRACMLSPACRMP